VSVNQVSGLGPLATKARVAASDMAVGSLSAISANLGTVTAGNLSIQSDGAGGWLQAIAKAMGQALGDKAKHLVELSSKMTDLQQAKSTATDPKVKQEEDGKNAQEFNKTMTEFQATGQEYSMLNSVFSTAIKSLGEALSSMARKQ